MALTTRRGYGRKLASPRATWSRYSSFFPTNPPLFNPKKQIRTTAAVLANMVQKAARKPSISARVWSWAPECSVTDAAMAAVTARPTEFPICDASLKTPPANDCVSAGKASEMMRFDTVKRTECTLDGQQFIDTK